MNINELRIAVIKDFGFAPDEVVVVSGIMGVPVSFLDKYCPEQFDIVGISKTWYGFANKVYPEQLQHGKDGKISRVTKLNDGPVIKLTTPPVGETYYTIGGGIYTQEYARIFIRKSSLS